MGMGGFGLKVVQKRGADVFFCGNETQVLLRARAGGEKKGKKKEIGVCASLVCVGLFLEVLHLKKRA